MFVPEIRRQRGPESITSIKKSQTGVPLGHVQLYILLFILIIVSIVVVGIPAHCVRIAGYILESRHRPDSALLDDMGSNRYLQTVCIR